MTQAAVPTRDRILKAADRLFNGEGIRAVSVDAVAAKAGVTKRTLYYHFRSKDELISAYLAKRDEPNFMLFQRWFNETDGDLADKVAGIFINLGQSVRHPKWKGCGFLRTSVELVDKPGHPAVVIGRTHKKRVENWLHGLFEGGRRGRPTATGTADHPAARRRLRRGAASSRPELYGDGGRRRSGGGAHLIRAVVKG